jgi:hypothetical protein
LVDSLTVSFIELGESEIAVLSSSSDLLPEPLPPVNESLE